MSLVSLRGHMVVVAVGATLEREKSKKRFADEPVPSPTNWIAL